MERSSANRSLQQRWPPIATHRQLPKQSQQLDFVDILSQIDKESSTYGAIESLKKMLPANPPGHRWHRDLELSGSTSFSTAFSFSKPDSNDCVRLNLDLFEDQFRTKVHDVPGHWDRHYYIRITEPQGNVSRATDNTLALIRVDFSNPDFSSSGELLQISEGSNVSLLDVRDMFSNICLALKINVVHVCDDTKKPIGYVCSGSGMPVTRQVLTRIYCPLASISGKTLFGENGFTLQEGTIFDQSGFAFEQKLELYENAVKVLRAMPLQDLQGWFPIKTDPIVQYLEIQIKLPDGDPKKLTDLYGLAGGFTFSESDKTIRALLLNLFMGLDEAYNRLTIQNPAALTEYDKALIYLYRCPIFERKLDFFPASPPVDLTPPATTSAFDLAQATPTPHLDLRQDLLDEDLSKHIANLGVGTPPLLPLHRHSFLKHYSSDATMRGN